MINIPDAETPWHEVTKRQIVVMGFLVVMYMWSLLSGIDFLFNLQLIPNISLTGILFDFNCIGDVYVYGMDVSSEYSNDTSWKIAADSYYSENNDSFNHIVNTTAKKFFREPCEYQGEALEVVKTAIKLED